VDSINICPNHHDDLTIIYLNTFFFFPVSSLASYESDDIEVFHLLHPQSPTQKLKMGDAQSSS
jgi:hypothetical protein